jgi:hypothetical protein
MYKIITVCVTIITLAALAGGFYTCDRRDRESYTLRRIHVEKCRGTPEEAARIYPYVN